MEFLDRNKRTNYWHYVGLLITLLLINSQVQAFTLIGEKTHIVVSENEHPVVQKAVEMFRNDMQLVSGQKPFLSNTIAPNSILVGTVGMTPLITDFISKNSISDSEIKGKWEAFKIEVVENHGEQILIVLGSDKRGTAYGVLELSRLIGVSPWVWWADCVPEKRTHFELPNDYSNVQQPNVEYRGIFINDEDLGFMPWSTKTIDKTHEKGATGPIAYRKVYKLMLRLRINSLWPAMHRCTVPFYEVEGNKETADSFAIVMSTSHHEPLMRNTDEWNEKERGAFNFASNANAILNFWEERLKELNGTENFYTLGIRGMGDVEMEGANSLDEKTQLLEKVITKQRALLKRNISPEIEKLPQVFVPYKEVLPIYENNLKLPDDITLMWCDDNYGYMTRQSNTEEQKRSGGTGVYYHISYLGRPHQYIWLSTTPPAMVYWQMKQSWNNGARKIWILNVGDIKPAEYDMEFYFNMAWDINSVSENNIYELQEKWLAREFGDKFAQRLGDVRNEYYRLAHIRRPEFMGWSEQEVPGYRRGRTPVKDTEFNPYAFGDEIYSRLQAYQTIVKEAEAINEMLPDHKKDAFYQLVLFPVKAAAEMNKKLLYAQKARLYARYKLPVANEYAAKSNAAFDSIVAMVDYYNTDLANGKWKNMMFRRAWGAPVYERAPLPDSIDFAENFGFAIWVENDSLFADYSKPITLTPFVVPEGTKTFASVFSYNGIKPDISIEKAPKWLNTKVVDLDLSGELRLQFSVDINLFKQKNASDKCEVVINNKAVVFNVRVEALKKKYPAEKNRLFSIDISNYKANEDAPLTIEGLGYSMEAILLKTGKENAIKYQFYSTSKGQAVIRVCMLPNHPINSNDIRFAVAVDGGMPQVVSIRSDYNNRSEAWKTNVLRNQAVSTIPVTIEKRGKHTIELYALDEGIVLDQLAIDFMTDRKFYVLP